MTLLQRRPYTELVVPAWVNSVPEFADRVGGICATTLPDNSTWGASGFILAGSELGGRDSVYLPQKDVVVQLDFYAGTTGSGKPLWNVAASLCEAVIAACEDESNMRRHLTLSVRGKSFGTVMVHEFYPISPMTKDIRDSAQYAHYFMDFRVCWLRLS